MDAVLVTIEEYRSVRQESLEALGRQQTIAQYGLAAVGATVGAALLSAQKTASVAAILLMGLIPLLAIFGAAMMAMEAQRVIRAGNHLRALERRVNATFQDGSRPLRWEAALEDGSHARVSGYGLAILVVVTTTAVLGPGLGGYLLAEEGLWTAFVAAELTDIAVLVTFVNWSHKTFQRLRASIDPASQTGAASAGEQPPELRRATASPDA